MATDTDCVEQTCSAGNGEICAENSIPSNIKKQIADLPEVQSYIEELQEKILTQDKIIEKLRELMKTEPKDESVADAKLSAEASTSQQEDTGWGTGASLADQVREAAENAIQESGFVYHESLGLYYDKGTGYYYDQNTGLYYDGINKTYYTYDETAHTFHVYHQVPEPVVVEKDPEVVSWENEIKKRKREARRKARERKRARFSEEEEGECSDSSGSEDQQPAAVEIEPCLRLMVLETQVKNLCVGTLFIVTVTGGTVGREGEAHVLCISDINVSKHHATFTYENGIYMVKDLGSRNGTYLNNQRLSVALSESDDHEIHHGNELRFGSTLLACHIHPGLETCEQCEPGLVKQELGTTNQAPLIGDKETQHKDELLRLRRRFALTGQAPTDPTVEAENAGYQDRAGKRRKTVGSIHHGEKTESASLDQSVPESNKGFKMLAKMGWQSGQALGKDGTGNVEPVPIHHKISKAGLGADEGPDTAPLDMKSKKRQESWAKARDRFNNIAAPNSGDQQ